MSRFVHTLERCFFRLTVPPAGPYAGAMRWDSLFNDMESQFAESQRLAIDSEINERARVEMVATELADRLRGALGCRIAAHLDCGDVVRGALSHAGADALLLDEEQHQVLVPYTSVMWYEGLGRAAVAEPSRVRKSIGLAHSLRGMARDRAELSVTVRGDGSGPVRLAGVIDRVGKDHLDLAVLTPGESRRSGQVKQVAVIPFAALAAIRSRRSADF